jgi:hypothetical protein
VFLSLDDNVVIPRAFHSIFSFRYREEIQYLLFHFVLEVELLEEELLEEENDLDAFFAATVCTVFLAII